jgi:hypothetical protein
MLPSRFSDVANTDRNLLRQEMHDLALLLSTDRSAFAPSSSSSSSMSPAAGSNGADSTSLPATYVNELSSALLTTPDKWVPVTGVIARHLQRVAGGGTSGAVSATTASASGTIHASAANSPHHHQHSNQNQGMGLSQPLSPASTATASPQLQIARAYFDTLAASAAASVAAASAASAAAGSGSAQNVSPTAVSALGAKLARLQYDRLQQIRALQQVRRLSLVFSCHNCAPFWHLYICFYIFIFCLHAFLVSPSVFLSMSLFR